MIPIREFNTICEQLVTSIDGLDKHILVAEDNHAVNKLTGAKGIILVATHPSAERSGKPVASVDNNAVMFFVITKYTPSKKFPQELDAYEATQQIIEAVKAYIIGQQEDGCSVFYRLQTDSIHIDPEFNIFGGFLGWSMSIVF